MKLNVEETICQMTLEEKASLCSGLGYWDTKPVERLGIRSFVMTDGPNGVRMQQGEEDRFGLNDSAKATCFPTGACLASSWNEQLLFEVGAAIGREAKAKEISLVLGPAVNIKRSPLCGRNFEYLSEDPLLTGKLAAAYVRGMQEQGVGATPKHFAVNNQERLRQTIDARVDERTLREIYLRAFEIIVKESAPWMLMSSYNQINGEFASQNKFLLHDILRREWGYEGLLVTDWYGSNERVKGVAAGQDLEMPGNGGITDEEIVAAVRAGALEEERVDDCVRHFLNAYKHILQAPQGRKMDFSRNHSIARKAAAEGSVLLKNQDGILPLKQGQKVAVIGGFAKEPRYQGGGSSHLNANQMDNALDALCRLLGEGNVTFAQGYAPDDEKPDEELLQQAVRAAREADTAVVFCGLTESFESEGFDRESMEMPRSHVALIEAVAAANPATVVVLQNGSPVEMPWHDQVKAILESYLGGEAGGSAAADILTGRTNPSGKLAETFPVCLRDNPSYLNFPGSRNAVEYREGVFVGYRYYSSARVKPRFPFGFGLSYTTFEVAELALSAEKYKKGDAPVKVSCKVRNTGAVAGMEVVQAYVQLPGVNAVHPALELKGFAKVALQPGEEKLVTMELFDLSYWDSDSGAWELEPGRYIVRVGTSSEHLPLAAAMQVEGSRPHGAYDQNTLLGDLLDHPLVGGWAREVRGKFIAAFTGGDAKPATQLLVERSTVEQPMRVLLCTGFLDKEKLSTLLTVLNGEDYTGRDTSWLIR